MTKEKNIYIIEEDGKMYIQRFEEIEDGKYEPVEPINDDESLFDIDDVGLKIIDSELVFTLYEGSHWERGDRDELALVPGYLEKGEYVTDSLEDAKQKSKEFKEEFERKQKEKKDQQIKDCIKLLKELGYKIESPK